MRAPVTFDRPYALVPARALEGAKARLGEALDAEERRELAERLLRRTVEATVATRELAGVLVVSPDAAVRSLAAGLGATPVAQLSGGLNEGLDVARARALDAGADAIVVVPADLPALTPAELSRVIALVRSTAADHEAAGEPRRSRPGSNGRSRAAGAPGPGIVALVSDRARDGTNLLVLAPPTVIPFSFGAGSRARHAALAHAAGARYVELDGPLTLDLDTPDDLLAAEAAGFGSVRVGT